MMCAEKQVNGYLVFVVGPSGAGKDSLISIARDHFSGSDQVCFVRRTITRPPSVGEDHLPATAEEFESMAQAGSFALHWEAHGLRYGLPIGINDKLARRHVVVANGSRAIVEAASKIYPDMQVVNVMASPEAIAARLEGRGRETSSARQARIARSPEIFPVAGAMFTIDNSGPIDVGGRALVDFLADLSQRAQSSNV
ncbi:phosphonate metabolism protein/1,5-bisphosphokinase (PRPP-forming) PhnN [Rhizobium sp.]